MAKVKKYVGGGNAEVSEEGKRQLKYQQNDEETKQAYEEHYKKETADNEATSKAVGDFFKAIPRKIGNALISKAYKKGGSASQRADGCAIRGRTKA